MDSAAPRLAKALLALHAPRGIRDAQLGDLEEELRLRLATGDTERSARLWYWSQVLRSLAPALACRARGFGQDKTTTSRSASRMETLLQDLRYALRAVRKSPGFTVIAVLTLALGIGVNSAIFSIVNVILFNDLPIRDPQETIFIWSTNARQNQERALASPADYFAWREQCKSFAGLTALRNTPYVLTGWKEPIRVQAAQATDNTFGVWGAGMAAGRDFLPGEDRPGAERVTILAHGFWQRHFGGDPEVIGRRFFLDGVDHTVVGVANPKLEFGDLSAVDLWVPLGLDAATAPRDQRTMLVIGRLKAGVTVAEAHQEVALVSVRLAEEFPATNRDWSGRVSSFSKSLVDRNAVVMLSLLMVMVGFVLLIACINVANMLLSRATVRGKEMAVRGALGAGRRRLFRQLLTESVVIAAAAALLGLGLAYGLLEAMQAITSGRDPIIGMVEIDGNVLLYTLLVTFVAPLLFGLLPSLRASRPDLQQTLRETANAGGGRRGRRSRGFLVASQVAMALMLMVTAGLVTRTVINFQRLELGFDTRDLLTMELQLPEAGYGEDVAVLRFYDALVERVTALPGAAGAGIVSHRPIAGQAPAVGVAIAGRTAREAWELPRALRYVAGPSFFETLDLPLLRGRTFHAADTADAPRVAVISNRAAQQLWPNDDALGQRVRFTAEGPWTEVVGIVGDVGVMWRQDLDTPQIYLPFEQVPTRQMALVVRTAGPSAILAPAIRREVWSLDPDQPVDDVRTMSELHYDALSTSYAILMLFVVFAGFALFMSAVGLYGVTSYAVSQRAQEIGIRMALGAGSGDVAKMIFRQGIVTVGAGTVAGLIGAWLLSRVMGGFVYGISTLDPVTFLGVPAVLLAVALAANLVPTRRATRIDPVASLRAQ